MILRRQVVDFTPELREAVDLFPPTVGAGEAVVDSVPELNEVVDLSPPTVGAGEAVVDDSVPELNEDVVDGFVVLENHHSFDCQRT